MEDNVATSSPCCSSLTFLPRLAVHREGDPAPCEPLFEIERCEGGNWMPGVCPARSRWRPHSCPV
ncbi:MAG: hypothetical protein ACLTDR_15135 [Adlercreutzia equolifaciens]